MLHLRRDKKFQLRWLLNTQQLQVMALYKIRQNTLQRIGQIKNTRTSLHNSHYIYYKLSELEYVQAFTDQPCCTSNVEKHKQCHCDHISDQVRCESLCSIDSGCKGYVMLNSSPDYCQLATTSSCPGSCRGPYDIGNIGPLDQHGLCLPSSEGHWNGGCMIKSGIMLYTNTFLELYIYIYIY